MSKVWHDGKKFNRQLKPGHKYWVVMDVATNLAPYEDSQLASSYVFVKKHPLLNVWVTEGMTDAEGLVLKYGPVYETKPEGIRDLAGPGPQVAGPLGYDEPFKRRLDANEIENLEMHNRANRRPARKPSWFSV